MEIDKVKVLILKFNGKITDEICNFIEDKDYVIINSRNEEDRYTTYPLNDHHFTTSFHRSCVIPALSNLLRFDFDAQKYHIVENVIEKNGLAFDLSYYEPNDKNYTFEVSGLEYDIHYKSDFKGLIFSESYRKEVSSTGLITDYHKLYAFPHSCSIVKNLYKNNGRTLLVSGDSQAIPFIPTLCTIFKEVWYFDNRSNKTFKDVLDKQDFTDILIEMYNDNLSYYLEKNLK